MKILLITSYPPMRCGIARYSANLVRALKEINVPNVSVACHVEGNGEFRILRPGNGRLSGRLLDVVKSEKPDVIHVQYNMGLYEGKVDSARERVKETLRVSTLKELYEKCDTPIVTTPHDIFVPFEYLRYDVSNALTRRDLHKLLIAPLGTFLHLRRPLVISKLSSEVVCLSETQRAVVSRGIVVYHGAEQHSIARNMSKEELREMLRLPLDEKLMLVAGFIHWKQKGYELLSQLKLPKGWRLVVQAAHSYYGPHSLIPRVKNAVMIPRYLADDEYSILLSACDTILLPYKIVHCSGVLSDSLANGLPFIASDFAFFREFASKGLGVIYKRLKDIPGLLTVIEENYDEFRKWVTSFATQLLWKNVALKHVEIYRHVAKQA